MFPFVLPSINRKLHNDDFFRMFYTFVGHDAPRPKSTDVQDLGKTLAEELREGRWPSTVAPWTHFTTKARRQTLKL